MIIAPKITSDPFDFTGLSLDHPCSKRGRNCNATIQAITEDLQLNPITANVFLNGTYNVTTNFSFANINISTACGTVYNFNVTCVDNITICGIQDLNITASAFYSLPFDCYKCLERPKGMTGCNWNGGVLVTI